MNDFSDELMNLEMGAKLESLYWTSTYKAEDGVTLQVGERAELGDAIRWMYLTCWISVPTEWEGHPREQKGIEEWDGELVEGCTQL